MFFFNSFILTSYSEIADLSEIEFSSDELNILFMPTKYLLLATSEKFIKMTKIIITIYYLCL